MRTRPCTRKREKRETPGILGEQDWNEPHGNRTAGNGGIFMKIIFVLKRISKVVTALGNINESADAIIGRLRI